MGFWRDVDRVGLGYAFDQRAERKAQEKAAKAAAEQKEQDYNDKVKAIFAALHDEENLAQSLQAVPDKERFIREKTGSLLSRAIDNGKIEPFRVALDYCGGDPNLTISVVTGSYWNGQSQVTKWGDTTLVNYALDKRSHDIAQELAAHPRLSIETASKTSGKTFEQIIEQAKDNGMSDVHETLKKRVAEVYRQRAAALDVTPIKL